MLLKVGLFSLSPLRSCRPAFLRHSPNIRVLFLSGRGRIWDSAGSAVRGLGFCVNGEDIAVAVGVGVAERAKEGMGERSRGCGHGVSGFG